MLLDLVLHNIEICIVCIPNIRKAKHCLQSQSRTFTYVTPKLATIPQRFSHNLKTWDPRSKTNPSEIITAKRKPESLTITT